MGGKCLPAGLSKARIKGRTPATVAFVLIDGSVGKAVAQSVSTRTVSLPPPALPHCLSSDPSSALYLTLARSGSSKAEMNGSDGHLTLLLKRDKGNVIALSMYQKAVR